MRDQFDEYVPSTADGKTWNIYTHKSQGRDPYVAAQEGVKEPHSFSFAIGLGSGLGDRRKVLPLAGKRLTAKVKASAVAAMKDALRAEGKIE